MVEGVLIVPAKVGGHALKLHEEPLQASAAVEVLELDEWVLGLGAC